ncbi:MAG: hypothetical protein ACLRZ9_02095 [Eubacterium sp.]
MVGSNVLHFRYRENETKDFLLLSTFFKICGYQMVEELVEDYSFMRYDERYHYDVSILLPQVSRNGAFNYNNSRIIIRIPDGGNIDNIIDFVSTEFFRNEIINYDEYRGMKKIQEIYMKCDLCTHEYNSQYYKYDDMLAECAYFAFQKAADDIEQIYIYNSNEFGIGAEIILKFASCYCAGRVIEMGKRLKYRVKYQLSILQNVLTEILMKDYTFLSAYELKADLAGLGSDSFENVESYYNKYFVRTHFHACASNAYYKLGKYAEEQRLTNELKKYYYNAYEINYDNYRAVYKLAMYYQYIQIQYARALKHYQYIIDKFEKKFQRGFIQPMELEYLFKSYFNCGLILGDRLGDLFQARYFFEKAESIENTQLNQMKFMIDFYGPYAQSYLDKSLKRLPTHRARLKKDTMQVN